LFKGLYILKPISKEPFIMSAKYTGG